MWRFRKLSRSQVVIQLVLPMAASQCLSKTNKQRVVSGHCYIVRKGAFYRVVTQEGSGLYFVDIQGRNAVR